MARTTHRQPLPSEEEYRTHWISGALSGRERERIAEKARRAPDLVVVLPLNSEWRCHRCGGNDDFLMMENLGPACLRCVGLDDLVYLPAGDALLSRRAKARASGLRWSRFSRRRRRYERRGILVEAEALAAARRELGRERGE